MRFSVSDICFFFFFSFFSSSLQFGWLTSSSAADYHLVMTVQRLSLFRSDCKLCIQSSPLILVCKRHGCKGGCAHVQEGPWQHAGVPSVFWPGALQGGPLPGPESHSPPPPNGEILKTEIAATWKDVPKTPRSRDAGKGRLGPDNPLEQNLFLCFNLFPLF